MNSTTNDRDGRARSSTASDINQQVDEAIAERVRFYASMKPDIISLRLKRLEEEWDVERYMMVNAPILALSGLALGATVNRKWLIVPGVVLSFLLQHAVQGRCPPSAALRKMGIRTKDEISREKVALQALRGDFDGVASSGSPEARAEAALRSAGGS